MSYHDKLRNTGGPRKLLACDGGGIRGILAIEILARLEAQREREILGGQGQDRTGGRG
jgi:patatin-like phospholipase/acyl hydrolase